MFSIDRLHVVQTYIMRHSLDLLPCHPAKMITLLRLAPMLLRLVLRDITMMSLAITDHVLRGTNNSMQCHDAIPRFPHRFCTVIFIFWWRILHLIILLLVFIGYIIAYTATNYKWFRYVFIRNIFQKINKNITMFASRPLTLRRFCGIIIV